MPRPARIEERSGFQTIAAPECLSACSFPCLQETAFLGLPAQCEHLFYRPLHLSQEETPKTIHHLLPGSAAGRCCAPWKKLVAGVGSIRSSLLCRMIAIVVDQAAVHNDPAFRIGHIPQSHLERNGLPFLIHRVNVKFLRAFQRSFAKSGNKHPMSPSANAFSSFTDKGAISQLMQVPCLRGDPGPSDASPCCGQHIRALSGKGKYHNCPIISCPPHH